MPRIVTLIASATEIVCALGFEESLVARSHECDFPESVKQLPVVTGPKFDPDGTSYEIDQRVKAIVQESLSVYRVDGEKLRDLQPDVIVTQAHCEVCRGQSPRSRANRLHLDGVLSPAGLAKPQHAGRGMGWHRDGGRRAGGTGARPGDGGPASAAHQRNRRQGRSLTTRPRVACIEWIDPLMAAGNWMPELVELAGGSNVFGEAGKHSPWMTWDQLVAADPDVIVLLPCGFDIARTRRDIPVLTSKAGWQRLQAVRNGRTFVADGNQFFNRPGPRLVESLEVLAELVHPEVFAFGHQEVAWQSIE